MGLDILFNAKSFAVVGASSDESKVGHQILKNLTVNKNLTLYPINLKGGTILSLPTYPHLENTPTTPEVAIICVPLTVVEGVIDQCIKVGVGAVVLITSGFAEVGEVGKTLQTTIIKKLSEAGIALLGPNSMGYLVPSQGIYASFGPSDVSPGKVAVISQSGAMLSALFQEYASSSTGVSFALSLGNMTGYDENDALEYAMHDEQTKVIAIYLESLASPQTFLTLAAEISRSKPIFLLKGGTTKEGSQAALSHTAALATSQVLLDSLCLQSGIVQVANFEQLVRASVGASKSHYLPDNLLIVTNAGGPGVVLT
ncbi:MAG: CoA-binding protein, partial [Microgenomates group bacterium]